MLMVDMAHIAGLVATGAHPSPVPYADVVTTTTAQDAARPARRLHPDEQRVYHQASTPPSSPARRAARWCTSSPARPSAFGEALKPEFKEYHDHVVENAKALAGLTDRGVRLVSGGTDNHLLLVDLTDDDVTGKDLEKLDERGHHG